VRDKAVDTDFTQSIKRRGAWYIPTLGINESSYIYAEHPEWLQQPFPHQLIERTGGGARPSQTQWMKQSG